MERSTDIPNFYPIYFTMRWRSIGEEVEKNQEIGKEKKFYTKMSFYDFYLFPFVYNPFRKIQNST